MNSERRNSEEQSDVTEGAVSEALGALPRVDAPNDFEMRVKARIAERESEGASGTFKLPRFVYALAGLILVAGAIVFVSISRNGGSEVAREVERSVPPVASESPALPPIAMDSNGVETARVENGNVSRANNGGVTDSAAQPAQVIEIGPNAQQPVARQNGSSVGVDEALSSIGAVVSFEGGAWTVGSVAAGSRASATGLKSGDAILVVDGTKLASDTRLAAPFQARMFLIKRPGKEDFLPLSVR